METVEGLGTRPHTPANLGEGGDGCNVVLEVIVEELGEEGRADTRLHLLLQLLYVLRPWHGEIPLQCLGKVQACL